MDDPAANPFLEDLFVDQPSNLPGAGRVHHEVFVKIRESVESLLLHGGRPSDPGLGRVFLMTASEAGYGKSHLVARIRDQLRTVAPTLFLPFDRSRPATWPVALSSILRQLATLTRSRQLPMSLLEELSRFYLARLLLGALASGAVKRRDCPEEPRRIEAEYTSLLSPQSDSKLLPWLDRRASDLAQGADAELTKRLGMGKVELAFWTRVFVDLNLREGGALDRLRGLSNGEARERLLQLLRIATLHRPVLIVADGLDGFHRSDTAGMEIAEIVNGIREKVPRSVALVCLNDDIWSSVFAGALPSAWRDRLDGEPLRLHSIGAEAAMDLVRFRLQRTRFSEAASACFAKRASEEFRWSEEETPLSPRRVLRQARELWMREASLYLENPDGECDRSSAADGFPERAPQESFPAAPPREEPSAPPPGETPPPRPVPSVSAQTSPPPPQARDVDLAGIDSIINDIRGTGKTVVSEAAGHGFDGKTAPSQVSEPLVASAAAPEAAKPAPAAAMPFPSVQDRVPIPSSFFSDMPPLAAPPEAPPAAPPLTRASFDRAVAQREVELLSSQGLALDLERIGRFILEVGRKHPALGQQEERYPSSRTVCLRWNARGHSVLVGFESPRNVYFWNNLLQQSLASNRHEKIAAFSHGSEPFDPSLFASFGFSPAVIRGRIDVIGMNDRELAMIYAAEQALREYEGTPDAELAMQLVTLRLDPLWRRMIQPL